jgi:hypothetical protein
MAVSSRTVLFLSILLIVWWIGVWGLCDTIIQSITKGNFYTSCIAYGTLIIVVLGYVTLYPRDIDYFI